MSASPEVMQANGAEPPAAPAAAPMMSPQKNEGAEAHAKTKITLVLKALEGVLADVGSSTEMGKAVLKAISGLAKVVGHEADTAQGLSAAEKMMMVQAAAGPGQPPKPQGPPPGGPPGAPPPGAAPPQPPPGA
jgi:hypothetical protein